MAEEAAAGLQGLNIQEQAPGGPQPTAILVIGEDVAPAWLPCAGWAFGGTRGCLRCIMRVLEKQKACRNERQQPARRSTAAAGGGAAAALLPVAGNDALVYRHAHAEHIACKCVIDEPYLCLPPSADRCPCCCPNLNASRTHASRPLQAWRAAAKRPSCSA